MKLVREYRKPVKADGSVVARQMAPFRREKREYFVVFCLDAGSRVFCREVVHVGTLTEVSVHPREIFKVAILRSAAAIVLAHNHPSGDLTPSEADMGITRDLVKCGKVLGIPVLDHVIVTARDHGSIDVNRAVELELGDCVVPDRAGLACRGSIG